MQLRRSVESAGPWDSESRSESEVEMEASAEEAAVARAETKLTGRTRRHGERIGWVVLAAVMFGQ
ncbi:hypothetical protein E2562_038409 [Oryza meyeriana var. granulata]|uniref:Uncharacterized protein n=1 Tax=Oryza meyeriana var. granulata TaxID=110450 RepID=A0A6G1FGV1_9ORYZ|nr:hypothetical protein E2562_038409 [Oryza meyeriana var. granulata]